MATRKTDKATAAPVETQVPAELPTTHNLMSWEDLVKDGVLVGAAADGIAADFRDIGRQQRNVERSASGISVIRATRNAFANIESHGVDFPADLLISASCVKDFPYDKNDKAEVAFVERLNRVVETVDLLMVKPAVTGWIEERGREDDKFPAYARMSRKDNENAPKEYQNARQQADNVAMEVRRSIFFGPLLGIMTIAAEKDAKSFKYGGALGFRTLCADVRNEVKKSVRAGKLANLQDIEDKLWDMIGTVKEAKATPEGNEAIQAAFAKAYAAAVAFGKFLKDAKDAEGVKNYGVDQRHIDLWNAMRGTLGDNAKFPFEQVAAVQLRPAEKTAEQQAADEKAAEAAKLAALNEADEADKAE